MTTAPEAETKSSCPNCATLQEFANKLGDESYRVDAARQHLAFALTHVLTDLRNGAARGERSVEISRIVKRLNEIQLRTRHAMNAPLPRSRRSNEPTLPDLPIADRDKATKDLVLRVIEAKCEELARSEPDGSHAKRALSDLSLLAGGWIAPESLGFHVHDPASPRQESP